MSAQGGWLRSPSTFLSPRFSSPSAGSWENQEMYWTGRMRATRCANIREFPSAGDRSPYNKEKSYQDRTRGSEVEPVGAEEHSGKWDRRREFLILPDAEEPGSINSRTREEKQRRPRNTRWLPRCSERDFWCTSMGDRAHLRDHGIGSS